MASVGGEFDDDLRVLGLGAELPDDTAFDLAEIEARHLDRPHEGHINRPGIGHALDAEVGGGALQGREDAALIGLENAHAQGIARGHGNRPAKRRRADTRRDIDAANRPVGQHRGRRQVEDVERKCFRAAGLSTTHPRTIAWNDLAGG